MKKFLALALAIIMLAAYLVSCGKKETAAVKVIDIDLTTEEYAFGVDKAQPELYEQVDAFIKKIKEDGTLDAISNKYFGDGEPTAVTSAELDTSKDQLVVATNANFEPFEYKIGDNYFGIDMEIADLLAKELGLELVINNMDFEAVCLSVGEHKCDIAMAGLTVKPDRAEVVNFTESYYNASQKIIALESDTTFDACETAADVEAILNSFDNTTKIGFQNGTTAKFYVEGDEGWGFDGFNVEPKGYKNGSLAVQDLINGNINYVIIDAAPADCITNAFNAAK